MILSYVTVRHAILPSRADKFNAQPVEVPNLIVMHTGQP